MSKSIKITGLVAAFAFLAACDNDLERAAGGALAGAAVGELTGNDVATSAAVGAAAGVFCDDVGVCQ